MSGSVTEILGSSSICICAGPGGVGKTTTSAAIAAGMAARGKRVAVLTIDPAKRLADSLGLAELGNEETRVDPARFAGLRGSGEPQGELWATMLDAKATFDDVVSRYAPDSEARERILGNRIYQQISGALAGSQEYMAMEKLYEIHERGDYDLLVLDTPPSRNALDFLDAPQRLVQFIEGRSLRLFLRPAGIGARIAGRGAAAVFAVLRRLTGLDLLQDLSEFFAATAGMIGGFRERAQRVDQLLGAEGTEFLIVCGPAEEAVEEAVFLARKLDQSGLSLGGVVVNRIHAGAAAPDGAAPATLDDVQAVIEDDDLAGRILAGYEGQRALGERDARSIAELGERIDNVPLIEVPELADEVHDVAGLLALGPFLFGPGPRIDEEPEAG